MVRRRYNIMLLVGFLAFILGTSSCIAGSCSCTLDLGLVVDTTRSIRQQNIPNLEAHLRELIQQFDVSADGTHVSFETFASQSTLHNTFNDAQYHDNAAIIDFIEATIDRLRSPTRLDRALSTANDEMFTVQSGDRPGVPSVMLLFTDGRSHPNTENFIPDVLALKSRGIRLVAVGIGPGAQNPEYQAVLQSIAGDDVFYVDDYDVLQEATQDIRNLICPPCPCENSEGLDVAFLVDRTRSIGRANFMLLKGFLLQISDALDIGPDATHTGVILFANEEEVLQTFADDPQSNVATHQVIEDIPIRLGSPTFIDRALKKANDTLFTVEGGDRPDFPNVLILFSDGRTNPNSIPFSEIIPALEEKEVRRVAVGIGNHENFQGQLEEIGGNNTYTADNFDELSDLFNVILEETCSVDGGFTRFSLYSECSVSCGGGVQTRNRTCTNPPPQGRGNDCVGDLEQTRECNTTPCYVESDQGIRGRYHAKFSDEWSKFGRHT